MCTVESSYKDQMNAYDQKYSQLQLANTNSEIEIGQGREREQELLAELQRIKERKEQAGREAELKQWHGSDQAAALDQQLQGQDKESSKRVDAELAREEVKKQIR